jgi:hypothetical protein
MKDRTVLYLIGLFVLGTGALIASDRHSVALVEKAATEAVKECSSCTLRHQSFARAKKAREKNQLKLGDQLKSSVTQPAQQ